MPLPVKSRPLLLTSTVSVPGAARVELHTTALELAQRARRTTPPTRQSKRPSASEASWKPPPRTVSGVPPPATTVEGETNETAAGGTVV